MLVNAERLEHTIGWQAPFGQCKYYVFSRYLKFVLTIHPFLSIHVSLIWTNGRWVSQRKKLKRKFECLLQAIWWPSLIIFKDVFFFWRLLKNINKIERQGYWIVYSYLQGSFKNVTGTRLSHYQNFKLNPLFSFLMLYASSE